MLTRIAPGGRLSQAVVANGFVFLSGQATENPALSAADQAREALARIDAILKEAGSDKSKIVRADIVLADIGDYQAVNEAWDEWVDRDAPPARTCAEARVSRKPYLVEISVVAVV
jgi:Putative translation initiation inhibitor, yjgF family